MRHSIAAQVAHGRLIGAIKTLREAHGNKLGLKKAKEVIDELKLLGSQTQADSSSPSVKLTSGRIDKAGTTLTLYRDGTYTTTGIIFTSDPDRLAGFSSDIDSMRRKSTTGRSAAFVVTGGISMLASNNRGVIYVTVTGAASGSKTYTSKNPDNRLLSSIRSLQATADQLLASPMAAITPENTPSTATTQPGTDIAAQLKMLADLHASGALSDDEFAAAKARLLA